MTPIPNRSSPTETGQRNATPPDAPRAPGAKKAPAVSALRHRAVPLAFKITIGVGPLVYFFLPNDFIPDATPKVGRLDDLVVLAAACLVALWHDDEARRQASSRIRAWMSADGPTGTPPDRDADDRKKAAGEPTHPSEGETVGYRADSVGSSVGGPEPNTAAPRGLSGMRPRRRAFQRRIFVGRKRSFPNR